MTSAEQEKSMPQAVDKPKDSYPYGLRITLDQAALDKLGIKGVPKVGQKFEIEALAIVESCHASASKDGPEGGYRSCDLQLTHLALDEGDDDAQGNDAASALYKEPAAGEQSGGGESQG